MSDSMNKFENAVYERNVLANLLSNPDALTVSLSVVVNKSGQQFKCSQTEGTAYLRAHIDALQSVIDVLEEQVKQEVEEQAVPVDPEPVPPKAQEVDIGFEKE